MAIMRNWISIAMPVEMEKHGLPSLKREEREKTGIKSLKIGYNRVFGYYIEVTRANLHLLKRAV